LAGRRPGSRHAWPSLRNPRVLGFLPIKYFTPLHSPFDHHTITSNYHHRTISCPNNHLVFSTHFVPPTCLAKPASPHGHAGRPTSKQNSRWSPPLVSSRSAPVPARACAFRRPSEAWHFRRGRAWDSFAFAAFRAAPSPLFTFSPRLALASAFVVTLAHFLVTRDLGPTTVLTGELRSAAVHVRGWVPSLLGYGIFLVALHVTFMTTYLLLLLPRDTTSQFSLSRNSIDVLHLIGQGHHPSPHRRPNYDSHLHTVHQNLHRPTPTPKTPNSDSPSSP
jgi:hypothetical protein